MAFSEAIQPQPQPCLLAQAYRAALDVDPADLEGVHALSAPEVECGYEETDGTGCTVKDLMIFPNPPVCMGYQNFCQLRLSDPKKFNRAANGNLRERAQRLGRNVIRGLYGSTNKKQTDII